jgi:hypothetical protein
MRNAQCRFRGGSTFGDFYDSAAAALDSRRPLRIIAWSSAIKILAIFSPSGYPYHRCAGSIQYIRVSLYFQSKVGEGT